MTDEEKNQSDQESTEPETPVEQDQAADEPAASEQQAEPDEAAPEYTAAPAGDDGEKPVNPVVGNIVLTLLGIYAIALSLLALDTFFGWDWFSPPRQDVISE